MDVKDFIGEKVWYDGYGKGYFWGRQKDGDNQLIAEIRGYGAIQGLFKEDGDYDFRKIDNFQDRMGKFIAEAINEKLERERKIGKKVSEDPKQIDLIDSVTEIACGENS